MKATETLNLQQFDPACGETRVFSQDCVNYVNLESFSLRKLNANAKEQGQ
jgi:hypothetical protein